MSIACALTVDMSFHINMLNPNMMDQIINEKISYAHRMPGHSVIYYSFTFGQKSPTYMPIWFVGESISIANVRKFVQNAMMCGNLGKSNPKKCNNYSGCVKKTVALPSLSIHRRGDALRDVCGLMDRDYVCKNTWLDICRVVP